MSPEVQALVEIAGRILLGALFVSGGIHHFFTVEPLTHAITARGMPAAKATLIVGSVFQIICGLALIIGLYTRWAALGLILFTVVASVLLIDFWNMSGSEREGAIRNWQSNLAIIGGLLITVASVG